jgi:hypothetical protein
MKKNEFEYYKKFGIQGAKPYAKRAINTIVPHTQNTLEHEVAKFVEAYNRIKMGHKIITEALEKETGLRRDLVDLTEQVIVEIETDKQRAKRHGKEFKLMKVTI